MKTIENLTPTCTGALRPLPPRAFRLRQRPESRLRQRMVELFGRRGEFGRRHSAPRLLLAVRFLHAPRFSTAQPSLFTWRQVARMNDTHARVTILQRRP